jgi:hypothetical protein
VVWSGLARRGGRKEQGEAWLGVARHGWVRSGKEQGLARRGLARNEGEKLAAWNRQHKSNYEVFL